MTKRSAQKDARRAQILNVALDLFVHKGFADTKISDIAESAGMSMGLMFRYFESKEKLYEELVMRGISKSAALMENVSDKPLDFFKSAAESILASLKSNPAMAKMFVLINQAAGNDFLSEYTRQKIINDNINKSAEIIQDGQKMGTIRDGNPKALAIAFWASIQEACSAVVLNPSIPYPESDWLIDIISEKEAAI